MMLSFVIIFLRGDQRLRFKFPESEMGKTGWEMGSMSVIVTLEI